LAFFLPNDVDVFPHPLLSDQDGFLAVGEVLSVSKVLLAYQFGIFPWYSEGEPVLWWFTNPRFVLFPDNLKIQKSMRSYLNQNKFEVTFDTHFPEVMQSCKGIRRKGQGGTWISEDMEYIYNNLHEKGYAHSVEVWNGDELVGGLYGLALGKVFYGESMFSFENNASKFGFIKLVKWLKAKGFELIDCQQETKHLSTLGAELIDGREFYMLLKQNIFNTTKLEKWQYC
jgi:leucyl/phenylalanyl-tRNA--protein transferase